MRYAGLLSPGPADDCRGGALARDDMGSPYVVPDTPPCFDLSGAEPRALADEEQGAAEGDMEAHQQRDDAAGAALILVQHPCQLCLLLSCSKVHSRSCPCKQAQRCLCAAVSRWQRLLCRM